MSTLKKIGYVFTKKQKVHLFFLFIMIGIGALAELVGVGVILPFISAILNKDKILESKTAAAVYHFFHFTSLNNFIIFLAGCIIFVYIIKNIFMYILSSTQYRFTYNNQRRLSLRMMQCYMKQPYLYHLDHNTAELSRNINEDIISFFEVILSSLQLATEGGVCVLLLGFLLYKDKSITIGIGVLLALFVFTFLKMFRRKLRREGAKKRECDALTRKSVLEALGSIKEIKVLDREEFFIDAYDRTYKEFAESQRKFKVYSIIPKPVMEAVCITGLMLVIAMKIASGVDTSYFIPTMAVFAVAAFRMLPSFNRIAEYSSRIMFNKPSVDAVYHDLTEIDRLMKEWKSQDVDTKEAIFEKEIKAEDICFGYPSVDKNVLDHITITIPKNKSVALIGPSGQGKTTLADVLLGLLIPQTGRVSVDGVDVRECAKSWHNKLGYIPQTISLLDATIRENIFFGLPNEKVDEERLAEAIKEAQLKEFIDSLENGLDTTIGERGVRLSGGQRQRIGIARALYNNPEILVLDEATSALDNDTEKAVMEAIDSLAGKKTLIIIAHRLTTIRNCDLVYEVNEGKVSLTKQPQ